MRRPLTATAVALLIASGIAHGWAAMIIEDGAPRAAIVIAANDATAPAGAATLLADYVRQSTGADLPIMTEGDALAHGTPTIHLGRTAVAAPLLDADPDLADDGFIIRTLDADGVRQALIVIAGPTGTGTLFGVHEFLERYVGVRWLLPGDHGTHVPAHATLALPQADLRQEPAYFSRRLSGLNKTDEAEWLRHMRMGGRVEFHHNLRNIFPPETWAAIHPEIYPLIDGERKLPLSNDDYRWQPCFTSPISVEIAADTIRAHFDANPGATSYSLGINDAGAASWCQCESCRAAYSGGTNFLGRADFSDPYYAWCEAVIDAVLEDHPDKWFGCLAYNNVIDPPTVGRVHERLIPYITIDRMQWADPQLRDAGHVFNERWAAAADTFGWYDYIYGRQYALPRVYFNQMAENLRYANECGVRAFYAEAYPNWGEGPKLYAVTRLLWDPDTEIDDLLSDWYAAFAGEAAAGDVARYFAHWEDFWTRRVFDSAWFRPSQYLPFASQAYLSDVDLQEMAQCRTWLESALAATETSEQRARVSNLIGAFEGYESSVLHHLLNNSDDPRQKLAGFVGDADNDALATRAGALLAIISGDANPLSRNPSFESGTDGAPDNWNLWVKPEGDPPHGTMNWIEGGDAATGRYYIAIESLRRGGPVQTVAPRPGRYMMIARYRLPEPLVRNRLELSVLLKDETGRELVFSGQPNAVFVDMLTGDWRIATRSFVIPENVGGVPVAAVQIAAIVERMDSGQRLDLDDVGVYLLPE